MLVRTCISFALFIAFHAHAVTPEDLAAQVEAVDARIVLYERMIQVVGRRTPAGETLAAAVKAEERARTAGELGAVAEKLRAAQQARDEAVAALLQDASRYQAARAELAAMQKEAQALREAPLTAEASAKLAAVELRIEQFSRPIAMAERAMWKRGEVDPASRAADALYKDFTRRCEKDASVIRAGQAVKDAEEAVRVAGVEHPLGKPVGLALVELRKQRESLLAELDEGRKALLGEAIWTHEVDVPLPLRTGKPQKPAKAHLWLPPKSPAVRGLILAHPPSLATKLPVDSIIRTAAAREHLGIILFDNLDALFDYTSDAPQRLEKVLADLAAAAGRPEITRVPWLTIGHSTSGIFARNVAYWRPARVMGIIHIKSGNFHQHRPDPARSLAGVPMLVINGEFEEFGPEGGIRKEYGAQTQWVMAREQLLRMRAAEPEVLASLVVHPGGTHGDWSAELTRCCAVFIEKAAQRRLPKEVPPAGIVECMPLTMASGWLTDADVCEPKHAPAAASAYAGDSRKAFWHFDAEMAETVMAIHRGRFILLDPTRRFPVPADWPPE